jgi:hypothetical protein
MSLTPKNWKAFQHYKERKPPWIKLHRELLDDYEFFRLPVASRALAPCIWLLASEFFEGRITASYDELSFRLRMSVEDFEAALKPLIDKGFFIVDSDALADCKQEARLETEREEEKRQRESRGERPSGNFERPKENGNRESESGVINAADRVIAKLTEAEQVQPQIRGGEGAAVVRLLPQGRGQ